MATQQEIATHLDLSSRRIRGLVKSGILPSSKGKGGYDIDACRIAYIGYLRGVSSGQVEQPGQAITEEDGNYSALLEKEKWRKEKRQNDLEENLVAPVELLTSALEKTAAQVIPILESLPLNMKRSWPEITGDQITLVKKSIAECRNAIASAEIDIDS